MADLQLWATDELINELVQRCDIFFFCGTTPDAQIGLSDEYTGLLTVVPKNRVSATVFAVSQGLKALCDRADDPNLARLAVINTIFMELGGLDE